MDEHLVLALADAPVRTGSLIRQALAVAGWTWQQFVVWIGQPGHLQQLLIIVSDVATQNWSKAVQDLAALFLSSQQQPAKQ